MNLYLHTYRRVALGALSYEDSERMSILRNANRTFFISQKKILPQEQELWYNKYLNADNEYVFSVFHISSGKWIGAVSIYNIDIANNSAEFGRLIIDASIVGEKGLGTDTTICVCQYAFNHLGITHLFLKVFEDNLPAIKTYLKAGFTEYGIREKKLNVIKNDKNAAF